MENENYVKAIGSITAILEMQHLSDTKKIQRIEGIINVFRKELEELLNEPEDVEKLVLNNSSVIIPIKTEDTIRGKVRY